MREVSACDFCGGEAAGTFEVLPPEVDGGRRMVLCPGCRDTLGTVLEPLLAATDDAPPAATPVGSGSPDDAVPASDDDSDTESDDGAAGSSDDTDSDPEEDAADEGAADEDATDGGAAAEDVTDEGSPDESASATAAGEDAAPPRGYRKVVRFLQNREFPIDRDHAVSMVTDVYDLEPTAIEAAIDHAVEEGRFAESGGQLTAP